MKNNYSKIILLISLICPFIVNGQITFEKIYPASSHESGKDILQTSDGGYIIAASIEANSGTDLNVLIIRTDVNGDTLYRKIYGGALPDYPNGILKTNSGNYFIVGFTQSAGSGDADCYLLEINPMGDSLNSWAYGGYGNEEGKEIISTSDGNYVIVGASNSVDLANYNMQLIKINPFGMVLWTKYYGGLDYESSRSVKQCADGGYIVAGKTIDPTNKSKIFLVRANALGDTTWTKTVSSTNCLEGKSILANADGSYTLAVDDSSVATDSDVRVMKFNSAGTLIWNKLYSGSDKDITKMIKPTMDGGYILTALSRSFGWVNPDFWLLKLNSAGDTVWTRHFGADDHEHCYAARQTSDGGYITIGHTRSYNPGRIEQIMIVKLDSNGNFGSVGMNEFVMDKNEMDIYPNPSNGIIHFSVTNFNEKNTVCRITNSLGQLVRLENIDSSKSYNSIDMSGSATGIYFMTIKSETNSITRKLILN